MNRQYFNCCKPLTGFSLSLLSLAIGNLAHAQQGDEITASESPQAVVAQPVLEEVVVIGGRLMSGAESLIAERQEQAVATDFIGAEQMSRIGDTNVAIALTRVPGVTLIENKFVFVRGLGERYSSTTLNGAMVPSPDLSRNVLPLDIIPTSIADSLAIQKVPSADKPAAFGGGSVDIRTTSIPDQFIFSLELSTGLNTESSSMLTYNGGGDDRLGEDDGTRALSPVINAALDSYRGNLTASNINRLGGLNSITQAQAINRDLALELNRDLTTRKTSGDPDIGIDLQVGNIFYLPNDMEFGFLAGGSYNNSWRNEQVTQRVFTDPEDRVVFEDESIYNVQISGNVSLGLRLNSENSIETTSLFLRDTDDEVSVRNFFNANRLLSDGRGLRNTELRYEQREMQVHQIRGKHELGQETLGLVGFGDRLGFLQGLSFDWYISDSDATTDLPNEVNVLSDTITDPQTGEVISSTFSGTSSSAAVYRFSELEDYVDSSGWSLSMPIDTGKWNIKIKGGIDYWQKSRTYQQYQFNLAAITSDPGNPIFAGELGDVLSDENVGNPDNGFTINNSRDNANSYIAANKVSAAFGQLDVTWDYTWRLVIGTRWEDYQQVNLPWDPVRYDGSQFPGSESDDPEEVAAYFQDVTYAEDDYYTSAALTWMLQDFWAEDFQLRLSFGETTVRPDLREISASNYFDPLTDISVNGNPDVVPTQIDNLDLRAEWFFSNGDNVTVSLFYKDIVNPIELFESAATDDNIAATIENAESAELLGLEFEFLKRLGTFSNALDPFFLQGNFTAMDSELVAGSRADAPTNQIRPLQGASDWVANLIVGFDSPNGRHAATLAYNSFGERLFFAGRNGAPDSFEQPFDSLNFTYSYHPTDQFTVKFKVSNLLDQNLVLQKTDTFTDGTTQTVDIYDQKRGQDFSLSVRYQF